MRRQQDFTRPHGFQSMPQQLQQAAYLQQQQQFQQWGIPQQQAVYLPVRMAKAPVLQPQPFSYPMQPSGAQEMFQHTASYPPPPPPRSSQHMSRGGKGVRQGRTVVRAPGCTCYGRVGEFGPFASF